jgi:hypothetical protein
MGFPAGTDFHGESLEIPVGISKDFRRCLEESSGSPLQNTI